MNTTRLVLCFAVIAAMALAGCGGRGGGGGPTSPMDQMGGGGGGGPTPSVSVFGGLSVDQTVADNVVTAIGRAAEATPLAGSVTQSSNVDSNGVTTDQVDVTAEYRSSGPSFSIRNGTEWSIGMGEGNPRPISDTDPPWQGATLSKPISGGTVYVEAYTDIDAPETSTVGGVGSIVSPGQSISYEGGGNSFTFMVRQDGFGCLGGSICAGQGLNVQNFSARENPDGNWEILALPSGAMPVSGGTQTVLDTDYLAGGVWLIVPDNATSAEDYVFGAFADGSDPFDQTNLMALLGKATYKGDATGVYSATEGQSTEIGSFNGDVELTADFGGGGDLGTISGSLTNLEIDGNQVVSMVNLGTANIGSQNSGFFEGDITGSIGSPNSSDYPERTYVGNWGGQFFGNNEPDGKPGSVAGTFGAVSDDGTRGLIGAFGAPKQ